MYVGETIQVSVVSEREKPFTAGSQALVLTKPDGTVVSPAPTVTVSPGTASNVQTLSAMITPALGGRYRLKWSFVDGAGETIIKQGQRFATWTDAEGVARYRLRNLAAMLSQYDFEREFTAVAQGFLSRYPQIGNGIGTGILVGSYNLMSSYDDQAFFDEAAALTVCARIVGPLSTGGAAADLVEAKEGNEGRQFARAPEAKPGSAGDAGAGPGGYAGQNERARWIREAAEKLGRVSFVSQAIGARSSFCPFAVWGPMSQKLASGQVQSLLSDVITLFSDQFDLSPAEWDTGK